MLGIYVHIPFCEKKCNYCNFASFVENKDFIKRYVQAVCKEIENSDHIGEEVDSIYIGGGTPSLIDAKHIDEILRCIYNNFTVLDDAEVSIECNPNSLTYEKLLIYRQANINRISLGAQSLDEDELKFLGRIHTPLQVFEAIANIKKAGFKNFSVDFILGCHSASFKKFKRWLRQMIVLDVKHISVYMLQVEEGTALDRLYQKDPSVVLDDKKTVAIYQKISKFLKKNRFIHYEISNFAVDGFKSRHNMKYWSGESYLGFGLSAHSYSGRERWANANNFQDYFAGQLAFKEVLSNRELIEEHIMLGLRCEQGVKIDYLKTLGLDIAKNENYQKLLKKRILFQINDRFFLNEKYIPLCNRIILELL